MFCQKCGTELQETSEFCHKCGAKQTAPKETQPSANIQEAETRQSVSTDINDFKNFVLQATMEYYLKLNNKK